MSTFVKKYPRAKVSRHATLDGWVIDILQREGVKPKRVVATYASIPWAYRAARLKLGIKVGTTPAKQTMPTPMPRPTLPAPSTLTLPRNRKRSPNGFRACGSCDTCGRPMRPAGTRTADYPGTTLRQHEGLCQSCNNKAKREGAPTHV